MSLSLPKFVLKLPTSLFSFISVHNLLNSCQFLKHRESTFATCSCSQLNCGCGTSPVINPPKADSSSCWLGCSPMFTHHFWWFCLTTPTCFPKDPKGCLRRSLGGESIVVNNLPPRPLLLLAIIRYHPLLSTDPFSCQP